ncbi:MAG TPA: hypothetical protein VGN43_12705, partial [Steroidobacteraceae bacterium]|nr:hypothetical protein [Steroidobacteraceae bacterium]
MTPTANLASTEADADDHATAPAAEAGPYVLNLCSSTTPMALAQTDLPELKRFTFFVSRRFEEGRERFRLHMGFFASQAEAEEWLGVVRDIYPGAWAGEAPGKKLRARAAEAAAAQARHAAGPQKSAASPAAPAPAAAAVAPVRAQSMQPPPPAKIPTLVPTLHPPASAPAGKAAPAGLGTPGVVVHSGKAAPHTTLKRAQSAPAAKPLPPVPRAGGAAAGDARPEATFRPGPQQPGTPAGAASAKAASTMAPTRAPQARAAPPVGGQRPSVRAGASGSGAPAAVSVTAQPKSAAAAPGAAKPPAQAGSRTAQPAVKRPIFADSNVKEVLAALDSPEDGTGETRLMPA